MSIESILSFKLRVPCVECADAVESPLPIERDPFAQLLAKKGWYLSVLTEPGQGSAAPIVFGALCPRCAKRVYPPEVLKAAEEARERLLS